MGPYPKYSNTSIEKLENYSMQDNRSLDIANIILPNKLCETARNIFVHDFVYV